MFPFRELLQSGTPFRWTDKLNNVFEESKTIIVSEIEEGIRIFGRSKTGLKQALVFGTDPFCCLPGWKVTLFGSGFSHAAKSRCAPVEG